MINFVIFEINHFQKPQIPYQIQQCHKSSRRRPNIIPLSLYRDQPGTVHQRHENNLKSLRIYIVPLNLKMLQLLMILRYKLANHLSPISTEDEIIEYESICPILINN